MSRHQKKRNSLLLYEFMVRKISTSLVEGDARASSATLKLLKKHFKRGSELYKEFRLLNSLVRTKVKEPSTAASILQEAKLAARSHDVRKLDAEKSALIRDVNHVLNDSNFYHQHVDEYKECATVQTLVNDWRSGCPDLTRTAAYEDSLVRNMLSESVQESDPALLPMSTGSSRLLMQVMMKKLNEKYSGALTDEQRELVRAYALSTASSDDSAIRKKLLEVKDRVLNSVDAGLSDGQALGEYVIAKLRDVRDQVVNEGLESIDDSTVSRFMLYSKLSEEMNDGSEVIDG